MHPRKVENCSNCTDQVIFRDSILETKRIKQLLLLFQSPHHCSPPTRIASEQGNHCSLESPKSFATKSATTRHQIRGGRPALSRPPSIRILSWFIWLSPLEPRRFSPSRPP